LTRLRSLLGRHGKQRSPLSAVPAQENPMLGIEIDQIVARIAKRTQHVSDNAAGDTRYQHLSARLMQLRGALELARLLNRRLARRIETHLDEFRRTVDEDC
jgi:hypothetical protein